MTKEDKLTKLHNLDLSVKVKQYTKDNSQSIIYVLSSEKGLFNSVVLDPHNETNSTLLSKLGDAFSDRHDPEVNHIFDLTEKRITYKFSVVELLKLLSGNPPVQNYSTIEQLFSNKKERLDE